MPVQALEKTIRTWILLNMPVNHLKQNYNMKGKITNHINLVHTPKLDALLTFIR